MINEEKVILMTKMASYESREGRKCQKVADYFRSDFIVIQVAKGLIGATISFGILFGLYTAYHFDEFMANLYKMDLISLAKNVLTYYVYLLVAYFVISYVHGTIRYYQAKKSLRNYYLNLKKLNSYYYPKKEAKSGRKK